MSFLTEQSSAAVTAWSQEQLARAKLVLRQSGTEADFSHTLSGLVESIWGLGSLSFEQGVGRDRMDVFAPSRRVVFELKRPGLEAWRGSPYQVLVEHSAQLTKYVGWRRGEWLGVLSDSRLWIVWIWNSKQPGEAFYVRPRKPEQLCRFLDALGNGSGGLIQLTDPKPKSLGVFAGTTGALSGPSGSSFWGNLGKAAAAGAIYGLTRRRRRGGFFRRLLRDLTR